MKKTTKRTVIVAIAGALCIGALAGVSFQVTSPGINQGSGSATGSAYQTHAAIGGPVAGVTSTANYGTTANALNPHGSNGTGPVTTPDGSYGWLGGGCVPGGAGVSLPAVMSLLLGAWAARRRKA